MKKNSISKKIASAVLMAALLVGSITGCGKNTSVEDSVVAQATTENESAMDLEVTEETLEIETEEVIESEEAETEESESSEPEEIETEESKPDVTTESESELESKESAPSMQKKEEKENKSAQDSEAKDSEPAPEPSESAAPEPEPEKKPEEKPAETPAPAPEPEPQPSPEPQPEQTPAPEPTPEAAPVPAPEPQPQPAPQPTPEPQPAGCAHANTTKEISGESYIENGVGGCGESKVPYNVVCTDCGAVVGSGAASEGHQHDTILLAPEKKATCTEDGVSEKITCSCGARGICGGTVIPATGHVMHTWYTGEVSEDGMKARKVTACLNCGELEAEYWE